MFSCSITVMLWVLRTQTDDGCCVRRENYFLLRATFHQVTPSAVVFDAHNIKCVKVYFFKRLLSHESSMWCSADLYYGHSKALIVQRCPRRRERLNKDTPVTGTQSTVWALSWRGHFDSFLTVDLPQARKQVVATHAHINTRTHTLLSAEGGLKIESTLYSNYHLPISYFSTLIFPTFPSPLWDIFILLSRVWAHPSTYLPPPPAGQD